MHSALAIAAVTGALKNLLSNRLVQQASITQLGDVAITTLSPDRISIGTDERTQLNLYLYRLTPNSDRYGFTLFDGHESTPKGVPLALNLHYLLTAYGEIDFQAEILLGHVMQLFLEVPMITREAVRSALLSMPSVNGETTLMAFANSKEMDDMEPLTISSEFLNMEEMTRLWSSLQAHARLSVTYRVSRVVIKGRTHAMEQGASAKVAVS